MANIHDTRSGRTSPARSVRAGDGSSNIDGGINIVAIGVHQNQSGDISTAETAYSLATNGNATGRNAPLVAHPEVTGTLVASGAGLSRPGGMGSETDLCVVYENTAPSASCFNRQRSDCFKEQDVACTQSARQYKDSTDLICFASSSYGGLKEGVGTLRAEGGDNGGGSENLIISQLSQPPRYIVRRLTPTECERLQGYPDGFTEFGHDGKLISDTRRYQMLGNSVAVPCMAYILLGITEQFFRQEAS